MCVPFLSGFGIRVMVAEINAKETKEIIAKINKAKSWFFEKIKKVNRPLARLIKKQRVKKYKGS